MSPQHIESLLADGGRYQSDSLSELEEHLNVQMAEDQYDPDANLAILKLYLLYPEHANVDIIELILVKALMAFPATDFAMCMFQIPEKYQHQLESGVIKLSQQLEMAKFKTFWKDSEEVEVLKKAKGWQDAVRRFIAGVVQATYRSIRSAQLADLMNMQLSDLDRLIAQQGWSRSKEDKEIVIVNTASFESVRVEKKPANTTMSLDQYRTLFMAAGST